MSLLDDVLAANAAVVEGSDVPVPVVPPKRRVVVVTCSEIRAPLKRDIAAFLGFAGNEAFVVTCAGPRVRAADGDVARSVVSAIAGAGGGEVFVVAHEGCRFLEADPESVVALLPSPYSSTLVEAEALCGESFISARKLAISVAETLRSSTFLNGIVPVHALVLDESRGRLSSEQPGYAFVASTSGIGIASGLGSPSSFGVLSGATPSPVLQAPGASGFGSAGPVSLFGSAPSSLMGSAPPPLVAPPPDLGSGAAAFMAPPPFAPPAPEHPSPGSPPPSQFVMPTPSGLYPPAPPPPAAPTPAEPPPLEPLTFKEPPVPPPPKPKPWAPVQPQKQSSDADDPFRRAAETLERLRRERRR